MADTSSILSSNESASSVSYASLPEDPEEPEILPTDDRTQFGLYSEELFIFRWTLRFLSLWCPPTACLAERLLYPILVSGLLLLIIASNVYVIATQNWKSLDMYVFMAIDLGMYTSHLFGVVYFKSRDLEENMLDTDLSTRYLCVLRVKLTRLKIGIILSYLMLVLLILLFFNTEAWLHHAEFQCNSSFKFLHGFASHFVCALNYPTNIYGVGSSLAISWTMCLFQQICSARLQQLSTIYLKWTGSAEEAIYNHLVNYSRKVRSSCSHLEKWFVIHNIILIIATPFVFTDIIKGFEEIQQTNAIHNGLFVGYLVYTIVIWVAPLYFAELLQIHDEDLCIAVNEFCPGTFNEEMERELQDQRSSTDSPNQDRQFTFHSRTEVNKFLSYLKNRKSGFLMGSFSFQFKLSMLSVFLAVLSFAIRFIG